MQIDGYTLPIEIKELGDDGSFKGIASVYGVEDLGGDIIEDGAFTKTLAENPTVPILWQHNSGLVMGEGTLRESGRKILIDGKLDMEDPQVVAWHGKMRRRLVKGLSIGFQTIKAEYAEVKDRMVRKIQELKLWEVSVVTFPMLPKAQITAVKSAEADRLAALEAQFQALRAEVKALAPADPPTEAAAGERAAAPTPEPVKDHSAATKTADAVLSLIS